MRFSALGFFFSIIFLFGIETYDVEACSGGGFPTVEGMFANFDYVVRAQIMETEDLGQNFVLHIEQHYKSEGPEFVLVVRNQPINLYYQSVGLSSGGDCIGQLRELTPGTILYGGLDRVSDGTYHFAQAHRIGYDVAYIDLTSVEELEVEPDDIEIELERIFTEWSDFTPSLPLPTTYPLKSPLIIHTNEQSYVLPVDWEINPLPLISEMPIGRNFTQYPPDCFSEGCSTISPDNLNLTSQTNDSTINFVQDQQIVGQSILFSSTSDTVAVWNECELLIYTTGYPIYGHNRYQIEELTQTTLTANAGCSNHHANAVWNPDGRLLAFTDDLGIWLWDVYSEIPPQHLLMSESNIVIRYFSPLGRYLAITEGDNSYNFDIFTDEVLPDGVVSPNDRLLLSFETTNQDAQVEICSLTPFTCDRLGMYIQTVENGEVTSLTGTNTARDVAWTSNSTFLVLTCHPEIDNLCGVSRWLPRDASAGWQIPFQIDIGYIFDYDLDTNQLAIVNDEATITVEGMRLDLSDQIEGVIEYVEWGESFFYRTHP